MKSDIISWSFCIALKIGIIHESRKRHMHSLDLDFEKEEDMLLFPFCRSLFSSHNLPSLSEKEACPLFS